MTKKPELVASEMIALTKDQKARMKKLGVFGETYADILERLLGCWKKYGHDYLKEATQDTAAGLDKVKASGTTRKVWTSLESNK